MDVEVCQILAAFLRDQNIMVCKERETVNETREREKERGGGGGGEGVLEERGLGCV